MCSQSGSLLHSHPVLQLGSLYRSEYVSVHGSATCQDIFGFKILHCYSLMFLHRHIRRKPGLLLVARGNGPLESPAVNYTAPLYPNMHPGTTEYQAGHSIEISILLESLMRQQGSSSCSWFGN